MKTLTPYQNYKYNIDDSWQLVGLDWPAEDRTIVVRSFSAGQAPDKIGSVRLLGFAGSLKWERAPEGLKVELPKKKPCEYANVLKISREE